MDDMISLSNRGIFSGSRHNCSGSRRTGDFQSAIKRNRILVKGRSITETLFTEGRCYVGVV